MHETLPRRAVRRHGAIGRSHVGIRLSQQARIGSQPDRDFILRDRLLHPAVSLQIGSEIASAHRIFRVDARRGFKMRMRFFLFALENQRSTEIIFSDEIVLRDRQRVRPQIVTALPVADLAMRHRRERDDHRRRRNRQL